MDWIETSGKTMEEAKEAAARELGLAVDEIEVEVVDEEAKGFLGLGGPKVRIRARAASGELRDAEAPQVAAHGSKAEHLISMLEQVLRAMEFDARPVLVSETGEEILVDFVGDSEDLGRLIGRHGQTLDAFQFLMGIAVNRGDPYKVRVLLDAEGYRARHQEAIESNAREIAEQVKATGEEAVLDPQNARDRRFVHTSLADDPDVYTYSEGEGDDRHVVISPKK